MIDAHETDEHPMLATCYPSVNESFAIDPLPIVICGLYLRRLGSETPKTRVFSEVKHGIGKT